MLTQSAFFSLHLSHLICFHQYHPISCLHLSFCTDHTYLPPMSSSLMSSHTVHSHPSPLFFFIVGSFMLLLLPFLSLHWSHSLCFYVFTSYVFPCSFIYIINSTNVTFCSSSCLISSCLLMFLLSPFMSLQPPIQLHRIQGILHQTSIKLSLSRITLWAQESTLSLQTRVTSVMSHNYHPGI